jgi:hypothetical protein
MKKNQIAITEIIRSFTKKLPLVTIIFVFCLTGSYFFHTSKPPKYTYYLEFESQIKWQAPFLGLDATPVNGIAYDLILTKIKSYDPIDYRYIAGDNFFNFETYEKVRVDNFFTQINTELTKHMKWAFNLEIERLKKNKTFLLEKKNISDIEQIILKKIETLQFRKDLILEQYKSILEDNNNKVLSEQISISLKQNFLNMTNSLNDIMNEYEVFKLNNLSVLNEKINSIEINLQLMNQKFDYFINDLGPLYSIKKISATNNNKSLSEIILAGILFGLLFNSLILFLISDYFKRTISIK